MFEDSTFASTGRIRMRTRAGFFAAFAFEGLIVLAMVLIPLLYPHALPNAVRSMLMEVPAPVPEVRPQVQQATARVVPTVLNIRSIQAPSRIPDHIVYVDQPEQPVTWNPTDLIGSGPATGNNPFGSSPAVTVVRTPTPHAVRLPSTVSEGMLVQKTIPVYPQIAIASRTQGTVELQATISRGGTIENLRVVSGPPMLQQAALDAVRTWRYRPYLLNGQPIEVETTVNVVFKLSE